MIAAANIPKKDMGLCSRVTKKQLWQKTLKVKTKW